MHARLLGWSLRHRRGRHFVNAIATAVTVAVVMMFVAVMLQLVQFTRVFANKELSRVLVAPKLVRPGSGTDGLPISLKATFERIEGVKVAQRKLVITGKHESGAMYLVAGEEDSGVELNKDIYPVDQSIIDAWKAEKIGAVVTEATAKDLRLTVGQTTELPTAFGNLQIKVVGIMKGALFTHLIGIHFEYMQQFSKNTDTCGYRLFAQPKDLDRVLTAVTEVTKNSPMPAQGISSTRFREGIARRASTIPTVLGFLGLFLLFTTALTLANNTAISIRERRVEVATMRVLGYKPRTIAWLLISEAVLVGFIGGLLAVGVMFVAFRGGVQLTPKDLLPPATMGTVAIAAGLAMSMLVPLLGALPSAIRAVRVPLVEGLRDA